MKHYIFTCTLFISLILMLSVYASMQNRAYAEAFTVKQYIIVPSDYIVSDETIENDYIPAVKAGIKRVQRYFASQLQGKSFNIDENVEIIHTTEAIGESKFAKQEVVANVLDLAKYVHTNNNVVTINYILGSAGMDGVSITWDRNFDVLINRKTNLVVVGQTILEEMGKQDFSDHVIAHELGHAFGLSGKFGWAEDHNCSQASPEWCQSNSPSPLPKTTEGLTDTMYWTYSYDDSLKKEVFHNTSYNPEIAKLYESPFLNIDKDTPPSITESTVGTNRPTVSGVYPSDQNHVFSQSDGIIINGQNFGSTQGQVSFYNSNYAEQYYPSVKINSWKDNGIEVIIGNNPYPSDTFWDLYITTSDHVDSDKLTSFYIKGSESPLTAVKVYFSTFCEENDEKRIAGVAVAVMDENNQKVVYTTSSYATDSLVFTPEKGKSYRLVAFKSGSNEANPWSYPISTADASAGYFSFNYASCTFSNSAVLKKSIQSISVNGIDWDFINNPQFPLHIIGDKAGTYYIPILITYTNGSQKQMTLTFNYDPNASIQPTIPPYELEPTSPSSSGTTKQCTYNESFSEQFHGCSDGLRECLGKKGSNGCEFTPGFTDPDDCRVISCNDTDFTPEPGHKPTPIDKPDDSPQPSNEPKSCERDTFYGCANKCKDDMAYEIWGCSDGTNKREVLNEDTNSDCTKACKSCDDLYYFDPNVDSCIHKRAQDDYPNCNYAFDQVSKDKCD